MWTEDEGADKTVGEHRNLVASHDWSSDRSSSTDIANSAQHKLVDEEDIVDYLNKGWKMGKSPVYPSGKILIEHS